MKKAIVLVMTLALVGSAMAFDLGNQAGDKPVVNYPQNMPGDAPGWRHHPRRRPRDASRRRTAPAPPPATSTTTTRSAPTATRPRPTWSTRSPPIADVAVDIDLLGSTYDTKVYVYDEDLALVACNDDFYPDYVSKIENVALMGGVAVLHRDRRLRRRFRRLRDQRDRFEPCALECPAGAALEGEPPLVDDYVDAYNGGCNSPEFRATPSAPSPARSSAA